MPLYEYRCLKCQKTFELRRSWHEREAVVPCPHCQSQETERVYSPFFGLRGSSGAPGGGCGPKSSGFG